MGEDIRQSGVQSIAHVAPALSRTKWSAKAGTSFHAAPHVCGGIPADRNAHRGSLFLNGALQRLTHSKVVCPLVPSATATSGSKSARRMDNDGPVCSDSWKAHTVIAGIIQGPENLKFFLEPNLAVMAAKTRNARRANLFYDFLTLPVSVRMRR